MKTEFAERMSSLGTETAFEVLAAGCVESLATQGGQVA